MSRLGLRAREVRLLAGRDKAAEDGLTLVELLVTVMIMGVVFLVVLGGITTAILGSDIQHRQVNADAALRTAADQVRSAGYVTCAAAGSYEPEVKDWDGYVITSKVVGWFNGTDFVDQRCDPDNGVSDQGLQLIELKATANARTVIEDFVVVKRR